MRSGHATGRTGKPEHIPLFQDLAGLDENLRQVQIDGVDTLSVVHEDCVAAEEEILGEHNATAVGRLDWRAGRGAQVRAGMRIARLTIENATMTEIPPAGRARDRDLKRLAPEAHRCQRRVNLVDLPTLARGALLVIGTQLDVTGFDSQFRRRELPGVDNDLPCLGLRAARAKVALDDERMLAGHGIEIRTDDNDPIIGVARERHLPAAPFRAHGLEARLVGNSDLEHLALREGQAQDSQDDGIHAHGLTPSIVRVTQSLWNSRIGSKPPRIIRLPSNGMSPTSAIRGSVNIPLWAMAAVSRSGQTIHARTIFSPGSACTALR